LTRVSSGANILGDNMRRLATHLAAALAALSAAGSEWIGSPPLDQADREWRSEVAAKAVRPAFLSSRHVGLAFDLSPLSLVSARDFESGREMASVAGSVSNPTCRVVAFRVSSPDDPFVRRQDCLLFVRP